MRVLIAPDKFKGSCTAAEAAASLADGMRLVDPELDEIIVPVADGGEGTLEAAVHAGFTLRVDRVAGPTGRELSSAYAVRDREAVIEMARASGLAVLPGRVPDPLRATSRGTGHLVKAALDHGCDRIVIGVGGSASTDAGAGILQALGARLLRADGSEVEPGGAALATVASIDLSDLDPRLASAEIVLAGDVQNPLLGENGAAVVFGPQKGANPDDVAVLDAALSHFVTVLDQDPDIDARRFSGAAGAGAAGGAGFAILAVLGGTSCAGIDVVFDLVHFNRALDRADLVVTGEGSLDEQSLSGKAPVGVAHAAAMAGVPVIGVCGRLQLSELQWRSAGFDAVLPLTQLEPDPEISMREAPRLLRTIGARIASDYFHDEGERAWKAGIHG